MFFKYFRVTPKKFEERLGMVAPTLTKAWFHNPISAEERLFVALKHLVTGDSQTIIAMIYRMSPTTVGRIIREKFDVMWDTLVSKLQQLQMTRKELQVVLKNLGSFTVV